MLTYSILNMQGIAWTLAEFKGVDIMDNQGNSQGGQLDDEMDDIDLDNILMAVVLLFDSLVHQGYWHAYLLIGWGFMNSLL